MMILQRKLAMATAKIIVDGNSLTVYSSVNLSDKLAANPLLAGATFATFGVSGQTTAQMLADQQAQIIGAFDGSKTNIVVALEMGNHIAVDGVTGAQAHTSYKQYGNAVEVAGGKFVACTAFDRNYNVGAPTPAVRTGINIANNLMRDQWPGYAHAFVDAQSIQPAIFNNADNKGYWLDGVHYEPFAYNLFAGYVAEAISKICR